VKPDTRHLTPDTARLDLAAIRERLASSRGQDYWRCLEELADSEEFHKFLKQEFPQQTAGWTDEVGRRDFLKLMGA
jgi:MoCo/4Fe-4S cofactor protein with predicted Tat translocation signal